ncbi:hypothetical protein ACOME3_007388 [Neoechinorhynchus agilis]
MLRTVFCNRSFRLYVFLCCFYAAYLILGAYAFAYIEGGSAERNRIDRYLISREKFLKENNLSQESLDLFLNEVLDLSGKGIGVTASTINETNWVISKSFMFVTTLITTVGYGHVSPATNLGKLLCIVYASFGIILTVGENPVFKDVSWENRFSVMLFSATMERMFYLSYRTVQGIIRTRRGTSSEDAVRTILFICVLSFILVFVFIVPSFTFFLIERPKWSLLDAVYFCFISVTTIGLGDYVPGEGFNGFRGTAYKLLSSFYIVVGALLMLFLLSVATIVPFVKHFDWCHMDYGEDPDDLQSLISSQIESVPPYIRRIERENTNETNHITTDSSVE